MFSVGSIFAGTAGAGQDVREKQLGSDSESAKHHTEVQQEVTKGENGHCMARKTYGRGNPWSGEEKVGPTTAIHAAPGRLSRACMRRQEISFAREKPLRFIKSLRHRSRSVPENPAPRRNQLLVTSPPSSITVCNPNYIRPPTTSTELHNFFISPLSL